MYTYHQAQFILAILAQSLTDFLNCFNQVRANTSRISAHSLHYLKHYDVDWHKV